MPVVNIFNQMISIMDTLSFTCDAPWLAVKNYWKRSRTFEDTTLRTL